MQGIDYLGVPTKVAWKPFYSQLPPPALRGPGGFGQLPPLRKNRPAIIEAGPMETGPAVVVDEGPADDEVTYWFGVMQNKMRERFAEVRPAGAMSTRLPACLFSSHAPHNTHHVPSSSDALLVAARPACLPPPQSPLPVSSSLPSSVSSSLPSFSVFLTPLFQCIPHSPRGSCALDQVRRGFRQLDKDASGNLDRDEFRQIL